MTGGCPHPATVWAGHPRARWFQALEVGPLAGRKAQALQPLSRKHGLRRGGGGGAPRLAGRHPPDPGKACQAPRSSFPRRKGAWPQSPHKSGRAPGVTGGQSAPAPWRSLTGSAQEPRTLQSDQKPGPGREGRREEGRRESVPPGRGAQSPRAKCPRDAPSSRGTRPRSWASASGAPPPPRPSDPAPGRGATT